MIPQGIIAHSQGDGLDRECAAASGKVTGEENKQTRLRIFHYGLKSCELVEYRMLRSLLKQGQHFIVKLFSVTKR
jgi:hypothetical protein